MTRKQTRAHLRTRHHLPPVLELPEEIEEELLEKEQLPPRRIPYPISVVIRMNHDGRDHKQDHNKTEAKLRRYCAAKIDEALHNYEDWIQDAEVTLEHHAHHHQLKIKHNPRKVAPDGDGDELDEETQVAARAGLARLGGQATTPFIFKAVVGLKNHRQVVYAHHGRQAFSTLTEAADAMVDSVSQLVRAEKKKTISNHRHPAWTADQDPDKIFADPRNAGRLAAEAWHEDEDEALRIQEDIAEMYYEAVEANLRKQEDGGDLAPPDVPARSDPAAAGKQGQTNQTSLRDVLM